MGTSVNFRTLVRRPNTQQVDQNRWGHRHNLIITMTGWGFLIVKMTDDYRKSWYIQYPHKWLVSQWKQRKRKKK